MSLRFARLTRPAVRSLAIGARIMEHGIVAERLSSGDIRYSVNIMVDGTRIHRVIGRESEGVTRAQAEIFIETARTDSRAGRLNLPKGRKLHRGFSEAASEYIKLLEETDGKNVAKKKGHLKLHLTPHFKTQRLDRITEFSIKAYIKKRREEGAAPGTINREIMTLSHLYTTAIAQKWIIRDAKPEIKLQPDAAKPKLALSQAQCAQLMEAAAGDQDEYMELFVGFGLNTGMRHVEITRSRFDDIDESTSSIWIDKAKAGARSQPITTQLSTMLVRARENAEDPIGPIFPPLREGKKKLPRNLTAGFKRCVVRAGLDPKMVTPHTMRRTAITQLIIAGVDLPTIMKISGHKSVAMLLRYFHSYGGHLQTAIANIGIAPAQVASEILGAVTHALHADGEAPWPSSMFEMRKSDAILMR